MAIDRILETTDETITAQMETGLSDVILSVRRRSDGYYLDWADNTFKASGWTTQYAAMTEVGTTGQYEKLFQLSSVTNKTVNDNYLLTATSATSDYSPQIGELKAGDWVGKLLSLAGGNKRIKSVTRNTDGNLLTATICGYATAADAAADTNSTFTISVTGTGSGGYQEALLEELS